MKTMSYTLFCNRNMRRKLILQHRFVIKRFAPQLKDQLNNNNIISLTFFLILDSKGRRKQHVGASNQFVEEVNE